MLGQPSGRAEPNNRRIAKDPDGAENAFAAKSQYRAPAAL